MLRGPNPPSWFAPELSGAARVRQWEAFIRDLNTSVGDKRWLDMEIELDHDYRVNVWKEKKTILGWVKARFFSPLAMHSPNVYRPTNMKELEGLHKYLLRRGLMTTRATCFLGDWEALIIEGGGEGYPDE